MSAGYAASPTRAMAMSGPISPTSSAFNVSALSRSLSGIPGANATSPPPAASSSSSSYNNNGPHPSSSTTASSPNKVRRPPPGKQSSSNAGGGGAGAQRNPLIDLIETEQTYVDELAMVIKKVAAAWSRSNFPPPALDTMFRAIEAVYRIEKAFLAKLGDIGPNPSSPKALGDLLMRWIDELEPAYSKYARAYHAGFDAFDPVQNNPNLLPILRNLPPLTSGENDDDETMRGHPTLDALFALPLWRLEYYKRLYAKLLKSTQPGKSDHALLVGANEKLDWLLDMSRQAAERSVSGEPPRPASSSASASAASNGQQREYAAPMTASSSAAGSTRSHSRTQSHGRQPSSSDSAFAPASASGPIPSSQQQQQRHPTIPPLSIDTSSAPSSSRSSTNNSTSNAHRAPSDTAGSSASERSSAQTTASAGSTALSSDTSATQISPVARLVDIERRLDTSRTLDIFTMRPKKCKLQINPPNLPYQRSVRHAADVQVSLLPASDPARREVFTGAACIFLLTDLFLLAERIPAAEQARSSGGGSGSGSPDMWLMYPPLATKHLRVSPVTDDQYGNAFEIHVMRKEKLTVFAESREARDEWLRHFEDAIAFLGAPQSLRVNTDVNRSDSPASGETVISGIVRAPALSPASWQSSGGSNPSISPLPPLPSSASTSNFPSSASNGRSPSPHTAALGRPFEQRQIPTPDYINSNGRGSPAQYPQAHQQPLAMRALPFPAKQDFSQQQQQPYHPPRSPHHSNGYPHDPQQQPYNQPLPLPPGAGMQGQGMPVHPHPHPGPPQSQGPIRKMPSTRSMASQSSSRSSKASGPASGGPGPMPPLPFKDGQQQHDYFGGAAQGRAGQDMRNGGLLSPSGSQQSSMAIHRSRSAEGLRQQGGESYRMPSSVLKEQLRGNSLPSSSSGAGRPGYPPSMPPSLPGSRMGSGYMPTQRNQDDDDVSPPSSPKLANVTSQLAAQMKCKVFIQQARAQWKSLGTAKLKLYLQSPTNQKQLVVEGDKAVLISTIVLEDGVERVGKTGVAIELSDNGSRTGIVYMIQLKTEQSATGLFGQLILGSSRASAAGILK